MSPDRISGGVRLFLEGLLLELEDGFNADHFRMTRLNNGIF